MQDAISFQTPVRDRLLTRLRENARVFAPTRIEAGLAVASALLLIFSFPDFDLWPLAWIGLAPLLVAVARRPQLGRAFLLGWVTGTLFFYGSCYWLTYAMVRYGGLPSWIAFPLLVPGALVLGLFPALWALGLARVIARWGARALFCAPFLWVALEWARLVVTGQLWNAIGYSQAYIPSLIQTASWGGVYAVGFLIMTVNTALAYLILVREKRAALVAALAVGVVSCVLLLNRPSEASLEQSNPSALVVALQPNVPMDPVHSTEETAALVNRHLLMSENALHEWEDKQRREVDGFARRGAIADSPGTQARVELPRVVIWPESPMNFTYAQDAQFREIVARFATENHASVLFNSLEPAPASGAYNSAVMVNEEGRAIAQYDKIRLLPFGEYVPLPRWLPGVNLVPVLVGDFTPGSNYPLMPLGEARAGVFICFEAAFPSIARRFAESGADVLINISNDGYLGPTPVMRQHLANAVFRAVENDRPILRVTNTGITAYVSQHGEVLEATEGFQPAVRTWTITRSTAGRTFYTRYGDLFVYCCAILSLMLLIASFKKQSKVRGLKSRVRR
ncbi:MAG TPA: apolipoprotein N-acyltransferase [Pyrinomonadaceae bacterium]|nr:apolipoprotein N-acyltransferase [Pyrinomonadaceae bacterium]